MLRAIPIRRFTAGVAATPGIDFGDNRPRQHLRFAYTTGQGRLIEAAERIAKILK